MSQFLDYALRYAQKGWPVFPLVPKEKMPLIAKNNGGNGCYDGTSDLDQIKSWWRRNPNANIGIHCTEFFVLDVDPDKGGEESLARLEKAHGALPSTMQQETGGGGRHYIFRNPHGFEVPNRSSSPALGNGLDTKASGGYIVAEPSIHPKTGNAYRWDGSKEFENEAILDAPAWLIEILKESIKEKPGRDDNGDIVIVSQGARDSFLISQAGTFRRAGWSEDMIYRALLEVNNTHCNPPLSTKTVQEKAASVCRYKPKEMTSAVMRKISSELEPARVMETPVGGDPNWRNELMVNSSGTPERILANAITCLRLDPLFAGGLAFDEFSLQMVCVRDLPCGVLAGTVIGDHEILLITNFIQFAYTIKVGSETVWEAVSTVARSNASHPVRNYLNGLTWDGTQRVEKWLTSYMGVQDAPYVRAVGKKWLIAAVARIMRPGCQSDHTLILEGLVQGEGKSTGLKKLFSPQWYTDSVKDVTNKDSYMQMQGKWIVEFAEFETLNKHEMGVIKGFLTQASDRFRPPYGRAVVENMRQCVFAGTVNGEDYLKDDRNRRFWPVRCGTVKGDKILADRDQIWAESVLMYEAGMAWHFDRNDKKDAELLLALESAQADRRSEDEWMPETERYLNEFDQASISEILVRLGKPKGDHTQTDQNRVSRCFKMLGCTRKRVRRNGVLSWVYSRSE